MFKSADPRARGPQRAVCARWGGCGWAPGL
jgi:hypothetical protein